MRTIKGVGTRTATGAPAPRPDNPRRLQNVSRRTSRWLRNHLTAQASLSRRALLIAASAIFLVSISIMFLYWQDASAEIARGDSTMQALAVPYRHEAERMLNGGGILFPSGNTDAGDARMILHPPGYAILMAGLTKLFGEPDVPLRVVQVISAASQAVIVVLIAIELLPGAVAIIAGLIVAFSPHLAYYSIFLSPDSMAVLPILIAVYLCIRASKRPRLRTIILAGIFAGLSCWLRSNALLLPLFLSIAVLFLFNRDKRWRYSLALIASTLLVVAPITIRNLVVYGRFIPISTATGLAFLQGVAEYDKQGEFGLPVLDPDVAAKEVEWYSRLDYAGSLYFPDGIQRDQHRLQRGLEVVRSNPTWFMSVMLRRMAFMLRYNDFWLENPKFNAPTAPAVSANSNYGHGLEAPKDFPPVWSRPMAEAVADSTFVAPQANVSVDEQGQWLEVAGDASEFGDQFISAPIAVEKGTDYILALSVIRARGAMSVKVRTADPRIVLAHARIPERKKRKKAADVEESEAQINLHFATGDVSEVRISVANDKVTAEDRTDPDRPVVRLGRADMFMMGSTPYRWTHYPRLLVRGIQKNLYKTEWMWLLILTGIVLLALAGRGRALLILLAVPAYYLIVHSALHVEYRYILAIHYFLFICAATSLYSIGSLVRRNAISGKVSQVNSSQASGA